MSTLGEVVRPLGPCEVYSSSRHALGFYRCVANTCRYAVPLGGPRGQSMLDALETAVANVILTIPSLTIGIAGQETSMPQFIQQVSMNIEDHFEFIEKENTDPATRDSVLLDLLEGLHDQRWPDIERRPPWKLIALSWGAEPKDNLLVFDVVFAVHHAIADGRSTALFHIALLNELNRSSGRPAQLCGRTLNVTGAAAGNLDPPQEELAGFKTTWGFLIRTLWRELGPAWTQGHQPAAPWTGKVITREPCKSQLRLVKVPRVAVPRILATCRENQTTLTPLIHALVLAALSRHIPREHAIGFRSSTPIDLRSSIVNSSQPHSNRNRFGVFVTAQSHAFDESIITALRDRSSAEEIWRVAASLRRSMKQHLDNVPNDDIMSMLSWVSDWEGYWLSKVGKPRGDTWEVSNIGPMPVVEAASEETGGDWKIQRSLMSQGATVAGAAISISVAGVAGGEIGIVIGWQEGIVETAVVEALATDLQGWLDRWGQDQDLS